MTSRPTWEYGAPYLPITSKEGPMQPRASRLPDHKCSRTVTFATQGYGASDGYAYGSPDLTVYVCDQHADLAHAHILSEDLLPYRPSQGNPAHYIPCGEISDYR